MAAIFYQIESGQTVFMEFDATLAETHDSASDITQHPIEDGSVVTDHVRPRQDLLSLNVFISNHPLSLQLSHVDARDALEDFPQGFLLPEGSRQPVQLAVPQTSRRSGPASLISPASNGFFERVALPDLPLVTGGGAAAQFVVPGQWQAQDVVQAQPEVQEISTSQFSEGFDRVRQMYEQFLLLQRTGQLLTVVTRIREYENMVIESMSSPRDSSNANSLAISVSFRQVRIVQSQNVEVPEPLEARGQVRGRRGSRATDAATEEEEARTGAAVGDAGPRGIFSNDNRSSLAIAQDTFL